MAAIGWTEIQAALAAWLLASTDLPVGSVIWTYPGTTDDPGQRPLPLYAALTLSDVRSVAQAAVTRTNEDERIRQRHSVPTRATLEVQLFADRASGEQGAVARLHDAFAALDLPEHIDALDEAGIGISSVSRIQLVAGRVNKLLEPRAIGAVELHLESVVESYVNFIARITASMTAAGDSHAFELELEEES